MGNICHAGPVLRESEAAPPAAAPPKKKPLTFGRDPTLKKEDYIFANIHTPSFLAKLPGSINGQQFLIENCSDCDIFLLDHCTAVQIDDCINCRIVVGPCESSLFLRNCKQCTIVCAVQQFRTRDCEDVDVYLYSSTEPIIETSTRMRFACYPLTYFSLQHQFEQAKFSVWNNRWSEVYNFSPDHGSWKALSTQCHESPLIACLSTRPASSEEGLALWKMPCWSAQELGLSIDVDQLVVPLSSGMTVHRDDATSLVVVFTQPLQHLMLKFVNAMTAVDNQATASVLLVRTRQMKLPSDKAAALLGAKSPLAQKAVTAAQQTAGSVIMEFQGSDCHARLEQVKRDAPFASDSAFGESVFASSDQSAACRIVSWLVLLAASGAHIASAADGSTTGACTPGSPVVLANTPTGAAVTDAQCTRTPIQAQMLANTNITLKASKLGIQKVLSVPADINTLILNGNGLTSLKDISLPSSLRDLELSNNQITSLKELADTSLTALAMTNNSITDITKIKLPSTLSTLNLAFNKLTKIPQMDELKDVTTLLLTGNSIASFKDYTPPPGLTSYDVSWNSISTFDGFALPTSVLKLYIGGNKFTSLKDLQTTNPLTTLYAHDLPLESIDGATFPDTVTGLSLQNCSLTTLGNLKLPSQLVHLDLSDNQLTSIPAKLPDTLRSIKFSNNQLKELSRISFPKSITSLTFDGNKIASVIGVAFPWSLKELTFGSNPITEFEVSKTDVSMLQRLEKFTFTTTQTSCKNPVAEKVMVGRQALCVLPDEVFSKLYSGSSNPGAKKDGAKDDDSSGGSSWVIPVVVSVAAVLAIGGGIAVYRSRRAKDQKRPMHQPTLADMTPFGMVMDGDVSGSQSRGAHGNQSTQMSYQSMFSTGLANGTVVSGGSNGTENNLIKFRIPTNEIIVQRPLAKGGYGIVFLATYQTRNVVVKKILPEKASDDRCLTGFLDEIKLCSSLHHPKIVRFIGVSWNTLADIAVIMEFMPNGDLDQLLKRQNQRKGMYPGEFEWYSSINLPPKAAIALDILDAIVYLHSFSSPIIHRDLKAKNVLLSEIYEAKLSDFGVSKEWRVDQTMTAGIGTMAWIAPEVLRGERYTEKADMYSFGVVLTELATCAKPFEGVTNALIVLKVTSGEERPSLGTDCPDDIRDLGERCLSYDPNDRPSAMVAHYELKTLIKAHSAYEL
ncbi:hypothetical protein ATCC90586_009492 [Pythium insidiosum]|nr:hypothetical protein ATCC90586_009492 [Pythium insidiosum]